jgi:hypothetical protein
MRVGALDRWLTPVSGMAAVTELVDRLGMIKLLDAAIGQIKARGRRFTGGQLLVGLATAQLVGEDSRGGTDRQRADVAGQMLAPVAGLSSTTAATSPGRQRSPSIHTPAELTEPTGRAQNPRAHCLSAPSVAAISCTPGVQRRLVVLGRGGSGRDRAGRLLGSASSRRSNSHPREPGVKQRVEDPAPCSHPALAGSIHATLDRRRLTDQRVIRLQVWRYA